MKMEDVTCKCIVFEAAIYPAETSRTLSFYLVLDTVIVIR